MVLHYIFCRNVQRGNPGEARSARGLGQNAGRPPDNDYQTRRQMWGDQPDQRNWASWEF